MKKKLLVGLVLTIFLVVGFSSSILATSTVDDYIVVDNIKYLPGEEVTELRDQYSQTFYEGDDRYSTRMFLGSIHYENDSGDFQPIDTTIVPSSKPSWDWEVTTGHWQLFVNNDTTVGVKKDGNWGGTRFHGIAYLDVTTKDYTILQTANTVTPVVSDNKITWYNILYGVDYVLYYTNDSLKADIVIHQEARDLLSSVGHRPSDYGYVASNTYLVPIFECDWSQSLPMKLVWEDLDDFEIPVEPDEVETNRAIYFEAAVEDRYFPTKLVSFLPVYMATSVNPVNPEDPEAEWEYAECVMKKRLVLKDGKHWLLTGVPVLELNSMPEGSIVFDPTETLRPSGAGDYTNIPSVLGAPTHWEAVDDAGGGDGDTTVVWEGEDAGPQRKDAYNLPASSIPGGATVNSVTVHFRMRGGGGTAWAKVQPFLRLAAVETTGTEVTNALASTYVSYDEALGRPGGGGWVVADLADLQVAVGLRVSTVGYITQVYIVVAYTGLPTVTTQAATNIEDTTATGNGNITDTGDENCDWRGIVYDLASQGAPGNVHPSASGYSDNQSSSGDFGTGAFTESLTGLLTGRTYYARAWAHNSVGYVYGAEVNFLTKPAAPTNVDASDGSSTANVTITWTKSTGATGYRVYEGANLLDTLGDVATYDDITAPAGTISNSGTADASDGTSGIHVTLSLADEATTNGASRTYKVVAFNATGDSDDSLTDTGYRGVGAITYQWQRSAADSDAAYGNIGGATTDPYNDVGAPEFPEGRWYRCIVSSTGASNSPQTSTVDRGFRAEDFIIVTTQAATNIEDTTATGHGNITATGGDNADWRGIVYDLAAQGAPGNVHPSASGYSGNQSSSGNFGTGAFTESLTGLLTGRTYYARAWGHNVAGYTYGAEISFLTKPATPTNVAATDGVHTDKVVITWTKSTGATDYHVWRDAVDLGAAGDVATFDDAGADAGTITPGNASASDGTAEAHVTLSLADEGTTNGTTHTYKVVASNATGDSDDSLTDTGYRGVGAITYQWQRSAADSDAAYGNIGGATTDPYNDVGAPANGDGRWYLCLLDATGATQAESSHDRGFRGTLHLVLYIDEAEVAATQLSGGVPGNPNNWVFLQNNVIPYADNISISVNSTQQLYFAPNAIIIGTNLPDRSGDATSNNGTISWGANPTGVTITVDSLTPVDAYGASEEALVNPDVVPEISPPELSPSDTTAKQGWAIFAPFMTAISAMTNTPLEWSWEWLNSLITLILIVLMFKVTNSVWMAGLGGLVGIGIGMAMSVFAGWMLIVAIIIVIGTALLDRTTSL